MNEKFSNIRKPAVAGMFYPGTPVELTRAVATLFSQVEKVRLGARPLALIAPHAGYPYSGHTAARAFKLLEGEEYDSVVIVSPSHTVFFRGCSVYTGDGYETPLGIVPTDHELAGQIASIHPLVHASSQGHATGSTRGEHALEVQLPFLQIALGKFKLVAIVMGDQEEESMRALGEVLASVLPERNVLMVASTDLSHFHTEKKARRLDNNVRKAVEAFDPEMLIETLTTGEGEACGGGPVAAIMMAARRLGSTECRFLEYTTSGEVTGDFDEVVGYLSAAIVTGEKAVKALDDARRATMGTRAAQGGPAGLTDEAKKKLHRIAREAIAARLENREYVAEADEALDIKRGLFVTLKIDDQLRGCIGLIKAREPLYEAVAEMARAAAFDDPRFPALTADEYERLEYEISVLSPLKRVHEWSEVKVGRDGLMIKLDLHSGLLLPQVATEYGWNSKQFLEQTCLKAGLPKDSYKDKFAEVYRFEAEVF